MMEEVLEKSDPFAAARAAKAAKRAAELAAQEAQSSELTLVPGQRLSAASRAKLEEMADIVPTNPDEYRMQANAMTRLKLANPGVRVRVVRARRGKFLRNEQIAPAKYREIVDYTTPDKLSIAGDDLARVAPGGMSVKFAIGDEALVTPEAALKLIDQGFVEPI